MMRNRFPDLNAEIVQGGSIGGISLGDDFYQVLDKIDSDFCANTFDFQNAGGKFLCCEIEGGAIAFSVDESGRIISIWCKKPYGGSFGGKLRPGMTAKEIFAVTSGQHEFSGYLILDGNYSVYYGMPAHYDDFEDFEKDIPDDLVFEELYVGNLLK